MLRIITFFCTLMSLFFLSASLTSHAYCSSKTVAYWSFDFDASESTGNSSLDGTFVGGAMISNTNCAPLLFNWGCLVLSGKPDRVDLPAPFESITGSLPKGTIESWAFLEDPAGGDIFNHGTAASWTDINVGVHPSLSGGYEAHIYLENSAKVSFSLPGFTLSTWHHLAWTWDGNEVCCYMDGNPVGSQPQSGTVPFTGNEAEIGSDDQEVSYWIGRIDEVRLSDAVLDPSEMLFGISDPGFLVFTSDEEDPSFYVYKMNSDGTGKVNLSNDYGVISQEAAISGDGNRIVWYGGPGGNASVITVRADGCYRQHIVDGGDAVSPDISGGFPKLAYVLVGGEQLRICNLDGTNNEPLTQGSWPDWSPDAKKIVYSLWASATMGHIWIYDLLDGANINLTSGPDKDVRPQWSPDGSRIVFTRIFGNITSIWVMDADGSNQVQLAAIGDSPSWSPDGSHIAFIRDGDIWIMNEYGTSQVNITNTPWTEGEVDWGPSPGPAGFTLTENFDSVPAWTSVNDLPGWSSHDGSGIYGSDAMIISDNTITTTPPNHMRVHGFHKPVWAMMHINSPGPIVGLILKFDYELQSNANGKVEISSSPGGGWLELGPLFVKDDNIVDDTFLAYFNAPDLEYIGVYRDAYIRWFSEAQTSTCAVFNTDTVEVQVITETSALRYGGPSIGASGCEPSIGLKGKVKIGNTFCVRLLGAVNGSWGYRLIGINSNRANIPFGDATLYFSPIYFFIQVSVLPGGGTGLFNGWDELGPLDIPLDQQLVGLKLNFQYLLADPGSSVYATAGLEVFIQ